MILEEIREGVVYVNGTSYFGAAETVKLPEIQFRTTERKPTGGIGVIELPGGGVDKMEMEISWRSYDSGLAGSVFNPRAATALMIRSVKRTFDASGAISSEEAVVTHVTVVPKSFGLGEHKSGESIEVPNKFAVHAIKQIVGKKELVNIDVINQIMVIGGQDLLANLRSILGI
ncbi:hypothetical protein GCM10027202_12560 [Microvirgula curvata]